MNSHSPDGEPVEAGPLDDVEIVGGAFVVRDENYEAQEHDAKRARFREVVERVATPDRFHRFVRGLYRWMGRRLQAEALKIGDDNEDFREATDLLYSDLKDSFLGPIIDDLSSEALERVLVYGAGFGAPVVGAYREVSERKRAEESEDKSEPVSTEDEGGDDGKS